MAAEDPRLSGEGGQAAKRVVHLVRAAFEEAPAPPREQCVAREQHAGTDEGDAAEGVAGYGQDLEFHVDLRDDDRVAVPYAVGDPGDILRGRPVNRQPVAVGQGRDAIDMVTMVMGDQNGRRPERVGRQEIEHRLRFPGVHDDSPSLVGVGGDPDVIVAQGTNRIGLDHWLDAFEVSRYGTGIDAQELRVTIMHPHGSAGNGSELWRAGYPAQPLLEEGCHHIRQALYNLFGYHIVQVGTCGGVDLLSSSRIAHQVILRIDEGATAGSPSAPALRCAAVALPIASDSVDVVVLPHTLEFQGDPHQVLREVERVLIGEGHVVIAGFNPRSLWGLWRLGLAWSERSPWNGRFLSMPRLRDWLQLLGFEVVYRQYYYYRPPMRYRLLIDRLGIMDKLGHHLAPMLGAAYLVVARKRIEHLIPIKTQWQLRRRLVTTGAAEPSIRNAAIRD